MIAGELLSGSESVEVDADGNKVSVDRLFSELSRRGWNDYFDHLQAAQLGVAGYWFLANASLEPCLVQQAAVLRHWLDGLKISLPGIRCLEIEHVQPELAAFAVALLWRLHNQAASRRMPIQKLIVPNLSDAASNYLSGQCEQLVRDQDASSVRLEVGEAAWLAPFVTHNRKLLPILSESLLFLQRQEDDSVAGDVYRHLESMPSLADANQVQLAQALAMSDRTLSRQLAEEGTSFRELLTRQRNARAVAGLCRGDAIDALTSGLGFSERAAFERAFKSWQGVTPAKFQAQYRRLSHDVDIERLISPEHLPALPAIATELLAMAQDDLASLEDMAALVERDPVLTAKLLNIACSAYYGLPPGTRIRDAVIRVFGVDRLRYLALSVLAASGFSTAHCPAFSMGHFWLVSLAVAQLASEGIRLQGRSQEQQADIYLAGLLHAIGRLVLVQCFPVKMQQLLAQLDQAPAPQEMLAMEKLRLGVDASEAGALLVAKWQLPRTVSVIMRQLASEKGSQSETAGLILVLHEYVLACLEEDENRGQAAAGHLSQLLNVDQHKVDSLLQAFKEKLPGLKAAANAL